ncbi:hypothetical protein AOXY_G30335 [Acipenser oxyrinchus oxyrinchus]|uniref:G-patch domain-containing protein n=1 Tax=Acipenser oxyrinchus oxyrinchus TaxID=40147 RepID=A0AAD8CM97_ACIOX|nr:hypothetical protein AOXY_G30335 [Acipenser oxyrinchus oxyrinchus]
MSVPVVYCVVSNIPAKFRSVDLRNYFSQFIEGGGFACFHYRHRPEVLRDPEQEPGKEQAEEQPECLQSEGPEEGSSEPADTGGQPAATGKTTCCCVVAVQANQADRFVKMYAGNQWVGSEGSWLGSRCVIRKIRVSDQSESNMFPYKTKKELNSKIALSERFTEEDLTRLPEMNPPALMPSGNVGTPVTVFLELIQACRLPPRIITKLGLKFPKTGSNRRYGNVPFEYRATQTVRLEEGVYTANGEAITGGDLGPGAGLVPPSGRKKQPRKKHGGPSKDGEESSCEGGDDCAESHSDDDDDTCEEWERHEALYEDVTNQGRCEERLFEEKIELKWEKGGSGLVFYTDAQYWKEEQGDFDEQTADDWDVDMSVYYDKDGGDKDARDYVRMRYEQRLRDGLEEGSVQGQRIGGFEKYTKGIGRRVMEKQGWKDGSGLGHSKVGMAEALENEGQHPKCKRGFGYHGEKLNTFTAVKKSRPEFRISTVYDEPEEKDQGDSLLRRQPPTSMKYRQNQTLRGRTKDSSQN